MFKLSPFVRRSCPLLSTLFLMLVGTGATEALTEVELNQLNGVEEREFAVVVGTHLRVTRPGEKLRQDTFVHPQVMLGERHCLAYIEETCRDRLTRNRPDPAEPGVRIVQVLFEDDELSISELMNDTGQMARVSALKVMPESREFEVTYSDTDLPRYGQKHRFRFFDGEFLDPGRLRGGEEPEPKGLVWKVTRKGDGELILESAKPVEEGLADSGSTEAGANCLRTYRLHPAKRKGYEITATISVSIGAEWSHVNTQVISLPMTSSDAKRLKETLETPAPAEPEGRILTTEGMLYVPFPIPAGKGGKSDLDMNDTAGLVVDLENLELNILAELIDDLTDRVREVEKDVETGGAVKDDLKDFGKLDGDLTLARFFTGLQEENLDDRSIADGIADTQARLDGLVFQFLYPYDGDEYAVAYSPGKNSIYACRTDSRWTAGSQAPLQFEAPDQQICFALRLTEENPLQWSGEEKTGLTAALAKSFEVRDLKNATVATQLPRGALDVVIGDAGSGADKIRSLKVRSSGVDRSGRMILNLMAADGDDSFRLKSKYLQNLGLPVEADIRHALGMGGQGGVGGLGPVRFELTAVAKGDFDVVLNNRDTMEVTVMADDTLFAKLDKPEVTVLLCHASDVQRKNHTPVPLKREEPETVVEMAIHRSGDRVEAGVYYSVDQGETWTLAEDGLYGFIYVEP